MKSQDPRIDAYIAKSQEFAKPILEHIRVLVHKAFPEIKENIKWGFPHFEYNGIVCSMASFKQHCAFGFWKAALMKDPDKIFGQNAMGDLGKIKNIKELPSDQILIKYIQAAVKLNEEGIKLPIKETSGKKELEIPEDFVQVLKKNKKAEATFENFNYTNKKDYLEWFSEAKTEETRKKRMNTAVEWLEEGKIRNWKYVR